MKTVVGYFFLALGATFAGVVLTVLYFVFTGKISLLESQTQEPFYRTLLIVYSIFHVLVMFPLFYYGIKWIKKDAKYDVHRSVNA